MWLKYIIENLPQYAKMHPHKKQYNIPANSMQHFTKGKNSSIDCVPMQCIDKSHTCLYYHYFKERTEKTGKQESRNGKEPCTFPLHCPFCLSILHDTCGNKSKLSRQATAGTGLAVPFLPSLTSDVSSTKQSDIWQYRRSRCKTVLIIVWMAFG